jgi:hypothetical protein
MEDTSISLDPSTDSISSLFAPHNPAPSTSVDISYDDIDVWVQQIVHIHSSTDNDLKEKYNAIKNLLISLNLSSIELNVVQCKIIDKFIHCLVSSIILQENLKEAWVNLLKKVKLYYL